MAWIESHQQLGRHPKLKRLARNLNISLPAAVGHLHYLWWWALDYAVDGNLSAYDVYDIADAALWDGEPEDFVQALLECGPGSQAGFLEETSGGLVLHDWYDYVGALLESRADSSEAGARGAHQRWHVKRGRFDPDCPFCQEEKRPAKMGDDGHSNGPPISPPNGEPLGFDSTVPNRTVPNTTEPGGGTNTRGATKSRADEHQPTATGEDVKDSQVTPAKFFESITGTYPPAIDRVVHAFESELEPSGIKWAMWEAFQSGEQDARYLRSILVRLRDNGLTSAELAEEHDQKRKARRTTRARGDPPTHEGAPNASAYTAVDVEQIRKWKELYPDEYDDTG